MKKALFIERFGAIIIDILLISLVANMLSGIFINEKDTKKLSDQEIQLLNDYNDDVIDMKTFTDEAMSINYQSSKILIPYSIIYLFLSIGYFVICQKQTGQTLGKKLLKIKVKSTEGKLTMNQMVVRGLIIDGIFFNMLDLAIILFLSKALYLNAYSSVVFARYGLYIVIAIMVMFRKDKRGLHDLVCHTEVVHVK